MCSINRHHPSVGRIRMVHTVHRTIQLFLCIQFSGKNLKKKNLVKVFLDTVFDDFSSKPAWCVFLFISEIFCGGYRLFETSLVTSQENSKEHLFTRTSACIFCLFWFMSISCRGFYRGEKKFITSTLIYLEKNERTQVGEFLDKKQ